MSRGSFRREFLGNVRCAVAQPGSGASLEGDAKDKVKMPPKLSSEWLFARFRQLEASGLSSEEAQVILTTSQAMAEWTTAEPLVELGKKVEAVDADVKSKFELLDKKFESKFESNAMRLNVFSGLVLFALCFLDVTNLESSIIGAVVKAVLKL